MAVRITEIVIDALDPEAMAEFWTRVLVGWSVTDVDRMGHVNNAAYWAAVEQRLPDVGVDPRRPLRARLDYRHPIDHGETVEFAESFEDDDYVFAFVVDSTVRAVGRIEALV